MSYTLKVDWESAQDIIVAALKDDLKYLKKDLAKIKKTKKGYVWSLDWKEDVTEINKRIEALKLVIDYYGS